MRRAFAGCVPIRALLASLSVMIGLAAGTPARSAPPLDRPLQAIDVADQRGRVWTLQDFDEADCLVVVFLGTECPLANLYARRVAELQQAYGPRGVAFVGVMSNRQDSIAEIAAFVRRHELQFPVLKDAGNRLADRLGAERTPEAFVLDRDRMVRYWGRVDDQYGIGHARDKAQTQDLRNAIDDLLAGRSPKVSMTRSVGCLIGRQKEAVPSPEVTFSEHVAPILQRRCVECHRDGEIAPFALTDYDEAVGWADMIAEVVREGRMPPWHANPAYGQFANDRSMTAEEKQILYDWADAGAPQGDPIQQPKQTGQLEAPQFASTWQLPREPDLVLPVSPEPFQVPAEGAVRYQYFKVDPKLSEERWLEAVELLPGNRAVVHHILCMVRPKGSEGGLNGARDFLAAYVPGARVQPHPPGMAKRIPANSELIFQVHYTPIGTPQTDHSKLGLVFADASKVTHEIKTDSALQTRLQIPPHDADYTVSALSPGGMPQAQLLSLSPHMHLRGKAFRYTLHAPDGRREILLDVPAYDFNWQTTYRLAKPLRLEPGWRIACTAVFDNSKANLNNPDPSATVGWGDQTWDEMMIGYFHYAVERESSAATR